MAPPSVQSERGFTIIEVLVAMFVLIVGLVGTFTLVDAANSRSTATKGREGATNLAREVAEQVRALPYSELTSGLLLSKLQARPGLTDTGVAPGWQVTRRGFDFTIATSVCSIDDGGDNYGNHGAGGFCADSTTTGGQDAAPEDLKRIVVSTSFVDRGRTIRTQSTTTVNSTGQANGLPISDLKLHSTTPTSTIGSPTEPVVGAEVSSVTFEATAPPTAVKVIWTVEGQRGSPDATVVDASVSTWRFSWPVSALSDGTYSISAQAVDAKGEVGPPREIPVRLARRVASAPTGAVAGFNEIGVPGGSTRVVELQWLPSPERNVVGYRVYRGPARTLVCPDDLTKLITTTSCIDFNEPEPDAPLADRTYYVRALYFNAANELAMSPEAPVEAIPMTKQIEDNRQLDFRLQEGTANTGTSCTVGTASRQGFPGTGPADRRDMRNGVDGAAGSMTGQYASRIFCSEAFGTDAQSVSGTALFKGHFTYNADRCDVQLTLRKELNGVATTLGTTSNTFLLDPTGEYAFPSMAVAPTALVAGERLTLTVAYQQQRGCLTMLFGYGLMNGYNQGRLTGLVERHLKTVTNQPDPPTNLTQTKLADGTVRLEWAKPTTGPAVSFYRIYANGTDYTQRVNTTGDGVGATDSYIVPGGAATYRVTAVAPMLTESTASNAVTVAP